MSLQTFSQSTLGAFRESPLGARETYATTAHTLRANGELRQVSVDTLETGELIGIVPDANLAPSWGMPIPQSIGGDDSVIWYLSAIRLEPPDLEYRDPHLYALDPTNAHVLSEARPFPDLDLGRIDHGWRVGGGSDVIWATAWKWVTNHYDVHTLALSPDTFEIRKHRVRPLSQGTIGLGIGGDPDVLWYAHTDRQGPRLWELSTDTLLPMRSRVAPGWPNAELSRYGIVGVDGTADNIWLATSWAYRDPVRLDYYIHELDPADLSVRQARLISRRPVGEIVENYPLDIGGN